MYDLKKVNTIYGNMYVYTQDPTIGKSLIEYGEYMIQEVELIKQFTNKKSFVLDVGANIGTHCIPLAPHVNKVVCFEPDKEIFEVLKKNCGETGQRNIVLNNMALSSSFSQVGTNFNFGKTTLNDDGDIYCVDLDQIKGFPSVDFIKIDVEGMELEVVKGAVNTIGYYKPDLLIEMQNESNNKPMFELLQALGYRAYWFLVPTFNVNNHRGKTENIFGNKHGVVNWFASCKSTVNLEPVIGADDTVQKSILRK